MKRSSGTKWLLAGIGIFLISTPLVIFFPVVTILGALVLVMGLAIGITLKSKYSRAKEQAVVTKCASMSRNELQAVIGKEAFLMGLTQAGGQKIMNSMMGVK